MRRVLFLLFAVWGTCTVSCQKQDEAAAWRKCPLHIAHLLQTVPKNSEEQIPVVITAEDGETLGKSLAERGIYSRFIQDNIITAKLTPKELEEVAGLHSVRGISGGRNFRRLHTDEARKMTQTDDVHQPPLLETPYTGRGVIIGDIDQGFFYTHPAFWVTPDSTRILFAKEYKYGKSDTYATPESLKQAGSDGLDSSHGTHVAGIAAGGRERGSEKYYGMAPDAHLALVSTSDLTDYDILNGVKDILEAAKERGEPCVINMSFGSNYGSHDGLTELDQSIEKLVEGNAILCLSAGNEGQSKIHCSFDFKEGQDTCLIIAKIGNATEIGIDLVGSDETPFEVVPCFFNPTNNTVKNLSLTEKELYYQENTNLTGTSTKKYHKAVLAHVYDFLKSSCSKYYMILRIKSKVGKHLDAFLASNADAVFNIIGGTAYAKPDTEMCIGELADIRSAITVGAYYSRTSWTDLSGIKHALPDCTVGNLAPYSSKGPMTDPTMLKPDVCAPGGLIISSIDKNTADFISTPNNICEKTAEGGTYYYYGGMEGTSMAAPCVSGIIALWLQANPQLTAEDVQDIIRNTSQTDQNTGTYHNNQAGWGKIDAYAGLKKALEKLTDIEATHHSDTPVSIQKEKSRWRILFNSRESHATLSLHTLDGKTLYKSERKEIEPGDETCIPFTGFNPGRYILKICTKNSIQSRKIIIQ